jgi:hypothetical protein
MEVHEELEEQGINGMFVVEPQRLSALRRRAEP